MILKKKTQLWSTNTPGSGAASFMLHRDYKLVLYGKYEEPLWAIHPEVKQQVYDPILEMQDDGNIVLYHGAQLIYETKTTQTDVKLVFRNTLYPNIRFHIGYRLTSTNGLYYLTLQNDSNLVLYRVTGQPLWATNTPGSGASQLVIRYDYSLTLSDNFGRIVWVANQKRGTGMPRLEVLDDGNLVFIDGRRDILWESGTSQRFGDTLNENQRMKGNEKLISNNGRYSAIMQADGNFVVYGGTRLWASNTFALNSTCYLTLQSDGNLVLYDAFNKALWASGTNGRRHHSHQGHHHHHHPLRLVMQDDGNLVLYSGTTPLWATNTNGRW